MNTKLTLAVLPALICPVLSAQTERDLDSHEHGAATMNIAVDNDALFIELNSPWNNFVGFEHEPSTDEQKLAVEQTLDQLNNAEKVFTFTGTDCTANSITVESSLDTEHGDEHDDHHDDKHADGEHDDHHDDKHADGENDDHHDEEHAKDDHDEHHGDENTTHSSVLAIYSFTCENINKLSAIDTTVFQVWSGFEELDVQLIGPGGQGLVELTASNAQVDLSVVQ